MLHIKSAAFYWLLSTIMVFLNKNLMNNWNFNYPLFLITTEMTLNTCSILVLNNLNLIDFKSLNRLKKLYEIGEFREMIFQYRYHFITSLFYCLHSVTALRALNGLSVPIYIILKRCGPFINLILSIFLFNKSNNSNESNTLHSKINTSIFAMTGGVIIASKISKNFDLFFLNIIFNYVLKRLKIRFW